MERRVIKSFTNFLRTSGLTRREYRSLSARAMANLIKIKRPQAKSWPWKLLAPRVSVLQISHSENFKD